MKRNCHHCQTTFNPRRKDKRYCSNSCKQMSYIQRLGSGHGARLYPDNKNPESQKKIIELIDDLQYGELNSENKKGLAAQTLKPSIDVSLQTVKFIEKSNLKGIEQTETRLQNVNNLENQKEFLVQNLKASIDDSLQIDGSWQNVNTKNPIANEKTQAGIWQQQLNTEKVYVPIKSIWMQELYARFNERGNDELLYFWQHYFKEKAAFVYWVSVRYRSLLEACLTVSEFKEIKTDDLIAIANAFTCLTKSLPFKELPNNYPYTKNIINLRNKLREICLGHQGEDSLLPFLKFTTKQDLLLQRSELALQFKKMSFNELEEDLLKQLADEAPEKPSEPEKKIERKNERKGKNPYEEKYRRKLNLAGL